DRRGDQPTGYATPSACFHTPEITITQARAEVALQSGHGEHRTSAAYIGGKPVKSYQSSQND
ncbi:hypothetical protein ACQ259_20350, partial [Stutzerimonas stutzeri]|uniref:hypothetical protein n=1 Tax=Stutzerimonas stutzeri TaxID=316 RepID=UPI003D313070